MPIDLRNIGSIAPNGTGTIAVTGSVDITGTPAPAYMVNGAPLSFVTNPAGANGQIQFNNAGTFGANANLFWDNANARLGIGTAPPQAALDVNSAIRISSSNVSAEAIWLSYGLYGANRSVISGGTYGAFQQLEIEANPLLLCRQDLSNGLVGIGLIDPKYKLDVALQMNIRGSLGPNGGGGIGYSVSNDQITASDQRIAAMFGETGPTIDSGVVSFYTANAGVMAERMRIDSQGRLGVRTANPASALHVNAPTNYDPSLTAGSAAGFILSNALGGELAAGIQTAYPYSYWCQARGGASLPLALNPLGGSVGIGTGVNDPQALLDVAGPVNATALNLFSGVTTGTGIVMKQQTAGDQLYWRILGVDYLSRQQTAIDFVQNSWSNFHSAMVLSTSIGGNFQERMRINYDGNVGIHQEFPPELLSIAGTDAKIHIQSQVNGSPGIIFDALAKYSIVRETPSGLLRFNGSQIGLSAYRFSTDDGVYTPLAINTNMVAVSNMTAGANDGTGAALQVTGGISNNGAIVAAVSDIRLKRDVEPFCEGLSAIRRIDPIRFKFNGKGGMTDGSCWVSVDARAHAHILPDCVNTFPGEIDGQKTDLYNFSTQPLIFALVNAVKELAARLEKIESSKGEPSWR